MRPILHALGKQERPNKSAAFMAAFWALFLCLFGGAFAQESVSDSVNQEMAADSELPFDQPVEKISLADVVPISASSSSVEIESSSSSSLAAVQPVKTVLYLGGGERSPWYHLGVLYAIEEFGIPVDSVVGTSWGAWVGTLWAKGVSPDAIQRILLDSAIAPYVGKDLSSLSLSGDVSPNELPVAKEGMPSIRKRFALTSDSSGSLHQKWMPLMGDSVRSSRALAKLRFQETLYRQPLVFVRPFSLQRCNEDASVETVSPTTDDVVASLPLWESADSLHLNKSTGELCPFYALPAEDNVNELALIVIADPLRNPVGGDAKKQLLRKMTAAHLANQPGLIIRSHAIGDTSRNAWIQAGFSAMEQRRAAHLALTARKIDYASNRRASAKPWFRFAPILDGLSPRVHSSVKSYWADSDTGFVGPQNFARQIQENPAYDSLNLKMLPSGDLQIEAVSHPTIDIAVGGFGSNAFGANAYVEGSVRYVDHIEMELILAGFWGGNSYGVLPKLHISKFLGRQWGLIFGYDYLKLHPLKSFNNDMRESLRIENEFRSDLHLSMYYEIDSRQEISAEFLFGNRSYELNPLYYGAEEVKTYPVSPMVHYSFHSAKNVEWFSLNGFSVNATAGMESIGFDFGIIDLVPIYWKLLVDGRFAFSPKPYLTFAVGAEGGMERYHEDGHGYVYPRAFDYRPLDLAYRLHAQATPWSSEWYEPELSSHEYGLIRASGSFHGTYLGAWVFAAYYHDFEDSPLAKLDVDKIVFEPALRFAYRSLVVYAGVNRIVDFDSFDKLKNVSDYDFFIRIGNY